MTLRDRPGPDHGHGDGVFTEDGCPVEMYAAMPPDMAAAHIVHSAVPNGSTILELGCGTGRISEPLVDLGHEVTGVDSSAAMLARLVQTRGVHSTIESLALRERFDVVLLASTLINTADPVERAGFLRAARTHARDGGLLLLERRVPDRRPVAGTRAQLGPVGITLSDVVWHSRSVMSATVVHELGDHVAWQDFSTEILDTHDLDRHLVSAGFGPGRPVSDDGRWMLADARRRLPRTTRAEG